MFSYEHTRGTLKLGATYSLKVGARRLAGSPRLAGMEQRMPAALRRASVCLLQVHAPACSRTQHAHSPHRALTLPLGTAPQAEKPILSVEKKRGKDTFAASYSYKDEAASLSWTQKPFKARAGGGAAAAGGPRGRAPGMQGRHAVLHTAAHPACPALPLPTPARRAGGGARQGGRQRRQGRHCHGHPHQGV